MSDTATTPPAPATERSARKTLVGVVTSRSGDKTVKVTFNYKKAHPKYRKEVRRATVFTAHDEANACQLGDRVEIMSTRPLSRTKRWRVVSIVEKAEQAAELVDEAKA